MDSPVQLRLEELPNADALDRGRAEIQDRLSETGSRLAKLNWHIMRNAAGKSLEQAFAKLDILNELADAWCTATELRDMAKKTLAAPGSEDSLALAEHEPSVTLHPIVSIKCGPVSFPALTFDLEIGAAVECAVLVVAGGKLSGIETGSFTPFARLSYGKHVLSKLDGNKVSVTQRYEFPRGGIPIPCQGSDESARSATDEASVAVS